MFLVGIYKKYQRYSFAFVTYTFLIKKGVPVKERSAYFLDVGKNESSSENQKAPCIYTAPLKSGTEQSAGIQAEQDQYNFDSTVSISMITHMTPFLGHKISIKPSNTLEVSLIH